MVHLFPTLLHLVIDFSLVRSAPTKPLSLNGDAGNRFLYTNELPDKKN